MIIKKSATVKESSVGYRVKFSANEFRSMFPEVSITEGSIITETEGLYSSGGTKSTGVSPMDYTQKYNRQAAA